MDDRKEKRAKFKELHRSGCFVMPNPWDAGTARYLASLGFPALATTSAGFAFSRALPDAGWAVTRDDMLGHIAEMAAAVDVPVNADFESGYGHEPDDVAANVKRCVQTGVAGLSIEDATGDIARPLYELALAIERIRAAREAIDDSGGEVLLTARAECFLVQHPHPMAEALRRLEAYAAAGADVLYAPGVQDRRGIEALVAAVAPKPVNILMSAYNGLTVGDVAAAGARRISVGSSLARAAWTGFQEAAKRIANEGSFAGFSGTVPYGELNEFFREDYKRRSQ